jgi:acyl-CoA thioesterase-1
VQQRIRAAAAVSAAVVVFAVAGYVIAHRDPVEHAGQTPGYVLTTAGSAPTTAASTAPVSHPPVIAFVGDDYTSGKGASAKSKRFSSLVAADLNASETNIGHDGAGYAKKGPDGKTYADVIAAVVDARPDVVVVTGGRNDVLEEVDKDTLSAAVAKLFTTLHEKLPQAHLIAVRPFWGDSDPPRQLTALAQMVKTAVTKAGGTYIGLADPLHGHPDYMADDADPNTAGHRAIARALEPKLRPLVTES